MTGDSFARQIPERIFAESEEIDMAMIQVTLLFDSSVSFRVYDEFVENIAENPDGSLTVMTELPDNDILYSYVLSFGDKVEVVAPESVRTEMLRRTKKLHAKYIT